MAFALNSNLSSPFDDPGTGLNDPSFATGFAQQDQPWNPRRRRRGPQIVPVDGGEPSDEPINIPAHRLSSLVGMQQSPPPFAPTSQTGYDLSPPDGLPPTEPADIARSISNAISGGGRASFPQGQASDGSFAGAAPPNYAPDNYGEWRGTGLGQEAGVPAPGAPNPSHQLYPPSDDAPEPQEIHIHFAPTGQQTPQTIAAFGGQLPANIDEVDAGTVSNAQQQYGSDMAHLATPPPDPRAFTNQAEYGAAVADWRNGQQNARQDLPGDINEAARVGNEPMVKRLQNTMQGVSPDVSARFDNDASDWKAQQGAANLQLRQQRETRLSAQDQAQLAHIQSLPAQQQVNELSKFIHAAQIKKAEPKADTDYLDTVISAAHDQMQAIPGAPAGSMPPPTAPPAKGAAVPNFRQFLPQ